MALNLEVIEVVEDIDPTTRQPRLRAKVRELKPRMHLVNLKNCDAAQIAVFQKNIGGIVSVPAREMLMDGRFMISIAATDEEFFIIKAPEAVQVSKVTEIPSSDAKSGDKPQLKNVG